MLKSLKAKHSDDSRTIVDFKFMWINSGLHSDWTKTLDLGDGDRRLVVLNPGRRKRFVVLEGEFGEESVSKLITKITSGNARFTRIGSDLPVFAEL